MTDKPDYIRVTVCPVSDPPAQVRVIRSELIHSMPAVEIFGLNAIAFIRSEIIHSMPVSAPISWLGILEPSNLLPDSITVGISHAF